MNPIHGSVGLLWSSNWAVCQAEVESILRGSFPAIASNSFGTHVVPMETMGRREQLRSVKTKGKWKGLSHSKARRKKQEHELLRNNMDSICKSGEWGDVTNTLQNADEKYKEKCSTFFSGQEVDEFIGADQEQMEYFLDLCNVKTSQTEVEAPCNEVGLELTLSSQE